MTLTRRDPRFAPPLPEKPIAIVGARVVDPASGLDAPGGLLTDGRRIKAVGPELKDAAALGADGSANYDIRDARGAALAPGFVDLRAAVREPGAEHMETLDSAAAAAAAGGIAQICATPDTEPAVDDPALVEHLLRRAREIALVRITPYAAATRGREGRAMTEMALLAEAGAVAFFDGDRAIADASVMRRMLDYARTFDLIIANHPEEPTLARGAGVTEGELATRLGLAGAPTAAETIMIARDLRLAQLTGGRLHIPRVTTAESVALIAAAKADGVRVTCDASIHHLALNEVAYGAYDSMAKHAPPLRAEADRAALVAGVASGVVDAVASDHAPWDEDSKRTPYAQAAAGALGLELLLPLLMAQVHAGALTLPQAIDAAARRPADALGFDGGRLTPGAPADAVLFDPTAPWRLTPETSRSKSRNSPHFGRPLEGRALLTMVGGRIVYEV